MLEIIVASFSQIKLLMHINALDSVRSPQRQEFTSVSDSIDRIVREITHELADVVGFKKH